MHADDRQHEEDRRDALQAPVGPGGDGRDDADQRRQHHESQVVLLLNAGEDGEHAQRLLRGTRANLARYRYYTLIATSASDATPPGAAKDGDAHDAGHVLDGALSAA